MGGRPPQTPLSTLTSFTWGCLDAFRKVCVLMKTLFDKVTHRLPSPATDAGTTECFCHGECGCSSKPFNSNESLHNSLNKNLDAHVRWFSPNPSIIHLFPRLKQTVIQLMQQKNQHCHVTVTARCQHTGQGQCCKLGQHFLSTWQ